MWCQNAGQLTLDFLALTMELSDMTFMGPCIAIYFYSKSNKIHKLLKFILFLG
jgi:hypothetical protein